MVQTTDFKKEKLRKELGEKLEKFFPESEYHDIGSYTREEVLDYLISYFSDEDPKEAREFLAELPIMLSRMELTDTSPSGYTREVHPVVSRLERLISQQMIEEDGFPEAKEGVLGDREGDDRPDAKMFSFPPKK